MLRKALSRKIELERVFPHSLKMAAQKARGAVDNSLERSEESIPEGLGTRVVAAAKE